MTRARPGSVAAAALVVLGQLAACATQVPPTPSPRIAAVRTPAPVASVAAPAPTSFFAPPRAVTMSTGVPARVACEVAPGRTLRLTKLDGDTAYGYESDLTPYSERDDADGTPQAAILDLSGCDLATGVVTRLPMPPGYPYVGADGISEAVYVVDIDQGRLLLFGDKVAGGGSDSYLLDPTSRTLDQIAGFTDRHVEPVALEGELVVGRETLETADAQTVAAVLRLGSDGLRLLTPSDLGTLGTWIRPAAIRNRIVVGDFESGDISLPGPVWGYDLDADVPIDVPRTLVSASAKVTGFDGGTIVGYAYTTGRTPQPFAWNIREPHVTWLPLPKGRTSGIAWGAQEGLAIGNTYGIDSGLCEPSCHREKRGIVWDLRTGAFLDLGTGPAELSGTLVADTRLPPESLVAALEGHRVLGFLGDNLESYSGSGLGTSISNFGGTPVVWDISDWLASIR